MLIRALLILVLTVYTVSPTGAAERSLADTIKKVFSTPTPTPKPRKKKKSSPTAKKPSPTPTASPKKKSSPATEESPAPSVTPSIKKKKSSPSPSPSASPGRKKKSSPTPEPSETPPESTSPTPTPTPTSTPQLSPSPSAKRGAPNATLLPNQIKGFEDYPLKVQKLLTSALELTTRNLDYKYGSADPATGGMDCSGFVYYLLKQNGIGDVPRDSSEQYVWLRRSRRFEAVLSQKENSFELEELKPGDMLFWTGTYSIERDPPITHAMIYLGREKKNGRRVMVGASDGRIYQGESRYGVSVFDFNVARAGRRDEGKLHPMFVGYGHIPGVGD